MDKVIANLANYVKERAEQSPLPSSEGKVLKIITSQSDKIDTMLGWNVFESYLTKAEIGSALTVGKTKLLDAIGKTANKGMIGKLKKQAMEELRAAGVVSTTESKSLREVRIDS